MINDEIFLPMLRKKQKQELGEVLDCNQFTQQFGLALTEQECSELMGYRLESLKEEERLELSGGILTKLIYEFCDSPYIYQDNYVESLAELQRIFYLYKNESLDMLTDDELIHYMKQQLDGACEGSLEHLEDTVLDAFCRQIRETGCGFIGGMKDD